MRWAGHVARIGGEEERVGRTRHRWVTNIRMDLERWDGVMWTGLIWLRFRTGGELL
jgi:hypothetical protein